MAEEKLLEAEELALQKAQGYNASVREKMRSYIYTIPF